MCTHVCIHVYNVVRQYSARCPQGLIASPTPTISLCRHHSLIEFLGNLEACVLVRPQANVEQFHRLYVLYVCATGSK